MKLRFAIRTTITLSIVLLCLGIGMYSFLRLNAYDEHRDFNLYTLVPQDAIAVLETDCMVDFVADVNALDHQDNQAFYDADLFVLLKDYLHTFVNDVPHGLSTQMNKMLFTFHSLTHSDSQLFYCTLHPDDYKLIEAFIEKRCSSAFPSKIFDYNGEEIRIYPLQDDRFLALYVTRDFLVASYQKRLVEQVIDAYQNRCSLQDDATFTAIHGIKRAHSTTLYLRMEDVMFGALPSKQNCSMNLGEWMELDLKIGSDAIYCSGVIHESDTLHPFIQAISAQQAIPALEGNMIPASTTFYTSWGISSPEALFNLFSQVASDTIQADVVSQQNDYLLNFLQMHAKHSLSVCQFQATATFTSQPCSILSIPLLDKKETERDLKEWELSYWSEEYRAIRAELSLYAFSNSSAFRFYKIPFNRLWNQFTASLSTGSELYAICYAGALLMAPDVRSLLAYVYEMEHRNTFATDCSYYENLMGSLSVTDNYLMLIDLDAMLKSSMPTVNLLPQLFLRQKDFFRRFIIAVQLLSVDNSIYPNIVLLSK